MASKIDYPRNDLYRKNYLEALEPWEEGRHEDCVEAAKYNLTDPTLPRYFQIKNRILIVSAEHDWAVAEQYRIQSERIYAEAVSLTKPKEIAEKRVLAALRIELDELKERHGGNPLLYEVGAAELKHGESQEEVVSSKEVKGELNENTSPRGEVEEELTDEAAAVQGLSLTKISE